MPPKKEPQIRLSPKYGVNPCIPLCYFCQQPKNEILLLGKLKGKDVEAPRNLTFDQEPCDTCKGYMAQGIILISVDEEKSKGNTANPYRTGGWAVVTDDAVRRIIKPKELLDDVLTKRVLFVPDGVWDLIGLPRQSLGA
jgi:hypothetical protein